MKILIVQFSFLVGLLISPLSALTSSADEIGSEEYSPLFSVTCITGEAGEVEYILEIKQGREGSVVCSYRIFVNRELEDECYSCLNSSDSARLRIYLMENKLDGISEFFQQTGKAKFNKLRSRLLHLVGLRFKHIMEDGSYDQKGGNLYILRGCRSAHAVQRTSLEMNLYLAEFVEEVIKLSKIEAEDLQQQLLDLIPELRILRQQIYIRALSVIVGVGAIFLFVFLLRRTRR